MDSPRITVLHIEDNVDNARLAKAFLDRFEGATFDIICREDGVSGLEEATQNPNIDIILMDYFLPGMNGLEVTRALKEKKVETPVVFLTVNKETSIAVEVMKLGVADYLLKEDITSHYFPQTLMGVVEKRRLRREVSELDVKKRRLEAMQELVIGISKEITDPLGTMKSLVEQLIKESGPEKAIKYLTLMKENIDRLEVKMEKLKNLKEDKTVQYIKDIKMIDIS
ncbi:MAG: response regulator [Bacteroidota bacterium]